MESISDKIEIIEKVLKYKNSKENDTDKIVVIENGSILTYKTCRNFFLINSRFSGKSFMKEWKKYKEQSVNTGELEGK